MALNTFRLCALGSMREFGTVTRISAEVDKALKNRLPVVALESTVITHGLPYPANRELALNMEKQLRKQNVIPATIAILSGLIRVGLNSSEIESLAKSSDRVKISRRDIPKSLSKGAIGGTTVSATMVIAHSVGIKLFATGGIGGVHRDVEQSMDVSCDLRELGRTPVVVICSGVKSILDIRKTLEVLETEGVAIATLGPTSKFPSFYSSESDIESPDHVKTIKEAAHLIDSWSKTEGLCGGMVLAVPVPSQFSVDNNLIETAISQALAQARDLDITGSQLTPFLLKAVSDATNGKSQRANIALLENNAKTAAKIAVELAKIQEDKYESKAGFAYTRQ